MKMEGIQFRNTASWIALTTVTLILLNTQPASGHGRLTEPPSRASAWRFGFPTPHNYNDHELFCGGFTRQWVKNGGNCGVCGDAWDQKTPRPHEYGGRFGQGITVRRYKVNSVITIKVDLTANHYGYFEFRLCPYMENTTQECLDRNVLKVYKPDIEDAGTKFYPTEGNKIYEMQYKLPTDLLCDHCVLQWKYIAGNNWGNCPNGTGAVGCGNQEEFRACADVAIGLTEGPVIIPGSTTARPRPPYVYPTRRTTTPRTTDVTDRFNGTTTETPEEERGGFWIGFVISLVMLVVVFVALALFYFYYYQGGHKIKSLLMKKNKPSPPEPPVRPPRHKKVASIHNDETVFQIKTDLDNNLEPGFENIKLNENRI